MKPPADFLSSLQKDDLVAATTFSSGKLHLIRIARRVTADMCRGEPLQEALDQMFDGRVLCTLRSRYWWRPTDQLEAWQAERKCWHCFAAWRRAGYQPPIKGWAKAEAPVESGVRLPWGWREVTPQGHPLDLPADAPEPDKDEDEKKVGSKRVEVKRWLRGTRYVRVTKSLTDGRFAVRAGAVDDKPYEESRLVQGGWDGVLLAAVTTMALGGSWNQSTRFDKLKMSDVTSHGAR